VDPEANPEPTAQLPRKTPDLRLPLENIPDGDDGTQKSGSYFPSLTS
jgi:hypothetical protein